MQPEELVERITELTGAADDPSAAFDPADGLAVDRVAERLLERFYTRNDGRAFDLLVHAVLPKLMQVATRITREVGVAVDPEGLVTEYLQRLFVDLRPSPRVPRHFLAEAERVLLADAKAYLEPSRQRSSLAGLLPAHQGAPTGDAAVARFGVLFLTLVQSCFHRLSETDRRVLIATDVDNLAYNQIAEALSIPQAEVDPMIRDARERFAQRIAGAFSTPPGTEEGGA